MLRASLKQLARTFRPPVRSHLPTRGRGPRLTRPRLEALEDRQLLNGEMRAALAGASPPLAGVALIKPTVENAADPNYFVRFDETHGRELWKRDGTEAGAVLVKDINPGDAGSYPRELTTVNGTLFFVADDGIHGLELWKSDGTEAGTVLVKDANPDDSGSTFREELL